jgi:hypothetical protein
MEAGMAKRVVVAFVFVLSATGAAQAIQCQALPDISVQGIWQWQIVDGRFCWHLGERAAPKEQLSWAPERADSPKRAALRTPQKIQCHPQPDGSKPGHWWWRTVDGKQCWYPGERETPRELLHWPEARAEPARHFQPATEPEEPPAEAEPAALHPWQLVNQESSGDFEFLALDGWIALMSIDLNLGPEFLTELPTSFWPVLAARAAP